MSMTTLFITQTNQLILQLNLATPTWAYFDSPTGQIVVTQSEPPLGLSTAYSTTLPDLPPSTTPQSLLKTLYSAPSYANFKALLSSGIYPPFAPLIQSATPYAQITNYLSQLNTPSTQADYDFAYSSFHSPSYAPIHAPTIITPAPTGDQTITGFLPDGILDLSQLRTPVNISLSSKFHIPTIISSPSVNISFPTMDAIILTLGNDTVRGTADSDYINGNAGNDLITGGGGNDSLYGGTGNDILNGGSGSNYLNGGSGNDTLLSYSDTDTLDGGQGSDRYYLRTLDSTVSDTGTGSDKDTAYFYGLVLESSGIESIYVRKNDAPTLPLLPDTRDLIISLTGSTSTSVYDETTDKILLIGSNGNDTFYSHNEGNQFEGGDGVDTLVLLDPVSLHQDYPAWTLVNSGWYWDIYNVNNISQRITFKDIEKLYLSESDDTLELDFRRMLELDPVTKHARKSQEFAIYTGRNNTAQVNTIFSYGYSGQNNVFLGGSAGQDTFYISDMANTTLYDSTGGSDTYVISGNSTVTITDIARTPSDIDTLKFSAYSTLENITILRNTNGQITSFIDTSNNQTTTVNIGTPSLSPNSPFEQFTLGFDTYSSLSQFEAAIELAKLPYLPYPDLPYPPLPYPTN